MYALFLICALVGGTIMVCQFVMTLAGASHDHWDVGQGGNDFHVDVVDVDGHDSGGHHGSTWLFSVVSFRTLVAAAAFFGLAGLASHAGNLPPATQFLIAAGVGLGAMYGTHWIVSQFGRLSEDGTVRINRAVGQEGTVYLSIPAANGGAGKVQIKVQDRLMEYEAVSDGDRPIPTGSRVVVVDIEAGNRLKVEPVVASTPIETSTA